LERTTLASHVGEARGAGHVGARHVGAGHVGAGHVGISHRSPEQAADQRAERGLAAGDVALLVLP
jgi:hypothetical protein